MVDIEPPWPRGSDSISALMQEMSDACWLGLFHAYPGSLLPDCRISNETEMRKELKERKALLRRKRDARRREGARLNSLRKLNGLSVHMDSELEHHMLACCLSS